MEISRSKSSAERFFSCCAPVSASEIWAYKELSWPSFSSPRTINSPNGNGLVLGHALTAPESAPPGFRTEYLGHPVRDEWYSSNNIRGTAHGDGNYFTFQNIDDVHNYLVAISTDKGGPQRYFGSAISRWPVESDWFRKNGTLYAVGRYMLFEVIRPLPNVRVRISLSRTLIGAGRTQLPREAIVEGSAVQRLPFVGNGCANVISSPIKVFERGDHSYFHLTWELTAFFFLYERPVSCGCLTSKYLRTGAKWLPLPVTFR